MTKINKKGFTLIELLVVVALIGLLSSIVFVAVNSVRAKARDARRYVEVENIQKALEMYYSDHGEYPYHENWLKIEEDADNNGAFSQAMDPYMSATPRDPLYPKEEGEKKFSYQYQSTADSQGYKVHVEMEVSQTTSYEVYSGPGGGDIASEEGTVELSVQVIRTGYWDSTLPCDILTDTVKMTNVGSATALSVFMAFSVADFGSPSNTVSAQMQVTGVTYDGVNVGSLYSDINGNGWLDLNDFGAAGEVEFTNVGGVTSLGSGETADMVLTFQFRCLAGNEYQDDYFTFSESGRITKD